MKSLYQILSTPRYFAVAWVFATLNILTGTWVLYIPRLKEELQLTDADLGFVLFSFSVGVLCVLPFVHKLSHWLGVGRVTAYGALLLPIWYVLLLSASGFWSLAVALFIAGIFSGLTDVAMNAIISDIEEEEQVKIMSAAHGFFSLGGVIGAGLGTVIMWYVDSPVLHIIVVGVLLTVVNGLLTRHYISRREEKIDNPLDNTTSKWRQMSPLFILAIVALIIMMNEGAIEHWSKLYMLDVVKVPSDSFAGLGFIAFSAMMTLGRFLGDAIHTRLGSQKLLYLGMMLAVLGHAAILMSGAVVSTLGFGVLGLGLSVIIPELFRIAGQQQGVSTSAGIAFVSGVGFAGFLLGPVLLGLISEATSLQVSFFALLLLVAMAMLLVTLRYGRKLR